MAKQNWKEIVYWNQNKYGSAIKIQKKYLKAVFVFLCVTTPGTNWLIPFIVGRIKDVIVRY